MSRVGGTIVCGLAGSFFIISEELAGVTGGKDSATSSQIAGGLLSPGDGEVGGGAWLIASLRLLGLCKQSALGTGGEGSSNTSSSSVGSSFIAASGKPSSGQSGVSVTRKTSSTNAELCLLTVSLLVWLVF